MDRLIASDGEYRTDSPRVGWFARTFPSLAFHRRFMGIVLRAARMAKRGEYDDDAWYQSSLSVLRSLEQVGVSFEMTGLDHLAAAESPCLIVGNHMSTLETTVLPCVILPRKVTFVVKQPLLEFPIFKHVMRSRDPIAVSQINPRQDLKAMLEGGLERLEKGISLVIFPEGERAGRFTPGGFNSIGVKLAKRAGVPIVPLALESSAWGIGKLASDLGKIDPARTVHFAFGPPLTVSGRGSQEHETIVNFIAEKLETWDGEQGS